VVTEPAPKKLEPKGITSRDFYWLGLAAIAIAFIAAAALTWRKWPDILIDFGTQLYVPWRILHGAVLYRDLFYLSGGPFSQYFNALLFKIFGVSFSTLIIANLVFAATMIVVVYRNFTAAADVWTATLVCLGIVLVFAFGQYLFIGNYNYVAPYTHEATHGLILSIFAIVLLSDWVEKGKIRTVITAGYCTGLVFLTKPDIFTALIITASVAFILFYLKHGKRFAKSLAAFLLAAIVPSLFFFFYFLREESFRESLRSVVFGWLPAFQGAITNNTFYRWCTGLDQPAIHLRNIILSFLAVICVAVLYSLVLRWMKNLDSKWVKSPQVVLLLLISPLLIWAVTFDWRQCGWPLPLLCLTTCVLIAWNYRRMEQPPIFVLLWSLFGLVLLAKLGLYPRISHYGFVLAMPAFASSIYLLFWLLPIWLEIRFEVPARQFRIMTGLVILIGIGNLFDQSQLLYAKKTTALGNSSDEIITYDPAISGQSQQIQSALQWTEKNIPPDVTLAVLPEGIMFNYLTRHINPTPCLFWDPISIAMFGQSTITDAFEKNPPDYIFLVEYDSSEYGVGYFGSSPDFGFGLMQWIQKNYRSEALIGNEPLKNGQFGIKILKYSGQTQSGGFNSSKSARPFAER
jgi:hypothetical protein